MKYFSQFGEDKFLVEVEKVGHGGIFVDVGAGDPVNISNTYVLEKYLGWDGVLIDADPRNIQNLREKRRAKVVFGAVTNKDGEVKVNIAHHPDLTSVNHYADVEYINAITIPSYRLETILKQHNIDKIDLLSIDVEGSELVVWESFNFEAHKPRYALIEYKTVGTDNNKDSYLSYFATLPYKLIKTTEANLLFKLL